MQNHAHSVRRPERQAWFARPHLACGSELPELAHVDERSQSRAGAVRQNSCTNDRHTSPCQGLEERRTPSGEGMEENLRHQAVVEALRERPFLSVNELRDLVGVSAATVRRDIEKFMQEKPCYKCGKAFYILGWLYSKLFILLRVAGLPAAAIIAI